MEKTQIHDSTMECTTVRLFPVKVLPQTLDVPVDFTVMSSVLVF